MDSHTLKETAFPTPATYRIRIQGHIDDSWVNQLEGLVITKAFSASKQPVTILVGQLANQASLSRVLNTLHELRLPVLSVENLDER